MKDKAAKREAVREYKDAHRTMAKPCGGCGGSGTRMTDCPTCHGRGWAGPAGKENPCHSCQGSRVATRACGWCRGSGKE